MQAHVRTESQSAVAAAREIFTFKLHRDEHAPKAISYAAKGP
jgi:hypothetical protein